MMMTLTMVKMATTTTTTTTTTMMMVITTGETEIDLYRNARWWVLHRPTFMLQNVCSFKTSF